MLKKVGGLETGVDGMLEEEVGVGLERLGV